MENKDLKSGIYVWKLNGVPKYVGQGLNVKKRMFQRHNDGNVLNRAIDKYGYDSFEKDILKYCESDELSDLEKYYIRKLHTHVSEGGYNVSWGGDSPMAGRKHSEKTKRRISRSCRGKNLGKHHSEESKKKMRENHADVSGENNYWYGKHLPKSIREKISESHADFSGENSSLFGIKHENTTSKYFGVYRSISKHKYIYWRACLRFNGRLVYLGDYKTQLEAATAYNKYVIEHNLPNPLNELPTNAT